MDTSEPSTNGTSASNLYRLSSLLNDASYAEKAKTTIAGFESETLQYPWLFASFMPSVVASQLGVRGVVVAGGEGGEGVQGERIGKVKEFEKSPRGGLGTFAWLKDGEGGWLRGRNELLKEFRGRDGVPRVMVCEGGVCVEEGVLGGEMGEVVGSAAVAGTGVGKETAKEIDVSDVKAALLSLGEEKTAEPVLAEKEGKEGKEGKEKEKEKADDIAAPAPAPSSS